MIMDFIRDQNPTALYEVGIKAGDNLPDYVKEATLLQEEDLVSLRDHAFADPVNRMHPIHTKAATYMSAVYLAGAGHQNSREFAAVKSAAELFGIEADVEAALALLPAVEKSASEELLSEKYALSFNIEEDDTWQAYPISNEVDVTKAATEIVRDWNDGHIPTDWFFHAARNVVKRANELGVARNEIPERVWRMGEERLVDFENAEFAISERLAAGVEDISEYTSALKSAAEGKTEVDEAIDTWMSLDAANNISHKRVTSPHEAFYSGMKLAAVEQVAESHVFINDVLIPGNEVEKLAANDGRLIKMAFRKETAEKIISIIADYKTEKKAAIATARLAQLESNHQKQLLNLLLKVA